MLCPCTVWGAGRSKLQWGTPAEEKSCLLCSGASVQMMRSVDSSLTGTAPRTEDVVAMLQPCIQVAGCLGDPEEVRIGTSIKPGSDSEGYKLSFRVGCRAQQAADGRTQDALPAACDSNMSL